MALWLTVTTSLLSRSAKLSDPLSLNVAAPLPSFIAPAASSMVSVGRSLAPVRVIVTSLVTVAPKSSVSVTVNTSVLIWPAARYCAALLFSV
ncbi:hypothetical protein PS726_06370 [Pseudomonas fluorescens]|nr:hypothetical protein PS726_06370 [Pseudomonas fluorescens]